VGLFAGTYMAAFSSGWTIGAINDDINTNISHIQIRDTAFVADNDMNAYFMRRDVEKVLAGFQNKERAVNVSYRLNINGMLASANNAVGVMANAVNVAEEKKVSTVWKTIPDSLGSFLPDDATNPIVISARNAQKLKVKLRSKIVFSFHDAAGEMQAMAFRVSGIFKTSNTAFDERTVFVRYSDLLPHTALPDSAAHVAAIMLGEKTDIEKIDRLTPEIKALFPNMDVKNWRELNPVMSMSLGMINMTVLIIIGIFLFALAFGIINTMLMAILERTYEIGMLGAVGMSKRKIFTMIMYETLFLTFAGGAVGIILAALALFPSIHNGVDLTPLMGDSLEDYGFSSVIYPVLNIKMFIEIVVLVIAAGILSAIYPALKALKLRSLDAIRE